MDRRKTGIHHHTDKTVEREGGIGEVKQPLRAVISSRQPAIIAGYSDENRRLLHSRNDTESIDTEQV